MHVCLVVSQQLDFKSEEVALIARQPLLFGQAMLEVLVARQQIFGDLLATHRTQHFH
jgi:hypothetical protein